MSGKGTKARIRALEVGLWSDRVCEFLAQPRGLIGKTRKVASREPSRASGKTRLGCRRVTTKDAMLALVTYIFTSLTTTTNPQVLLPIITSNDSQEHILLFCITYVQLHTRNGCPEHSIQKRKEAPRRILLREDNVLTMTLRRRLLSRA